MRQPVSRAANRAFCPSLPMASDSWKSGTTTRAVFARSSTTRTETTFAGDSAFPTKRRRQIDVKVTRKGATVWFRKEYVLKPPPANSSKKGH